MTTEVAVLNKHAAAIAADSAVTTGFRGREKIYNTANKIFTLSKVAPVGIMINGHVEHFGLPWEVIIKSYRQTLGGTTYGTLREYVDGFVSYVSSSRFVTKEGQELTILSASMATYGELVKRLVGKKASPKWNAKVIKAALEEMLKSASLMEMIEGYSDITFGLFAKSYGALVDSFLDTDDLAPRGIPLSCRSMFKKAVHAYFVHTMRGRLSTGIVVCGFGEEELTPKLFELVMDGGAFDRCRFFEKKSADETVEKDGAVIHTFAIDRTINSFMNGYDRGYNLFSVGFFWGLLTETVEEVLKEHTNYAEDERKVVNSLVNKKIDGALSDILKELGEYSKDNYRRPVIDALRSAPKEMLAELAESLVSLTSLRQRVSGELETVSGPIDVAVISKGDGFIWIKRKHYFQPELNPHFEKNYLRGIVS